MVLLVVKKSSEMWAGDRGRIKVGWSEGDRGWDPAKYSKLQGYQANVGSKYVGKHIHKQCLALSFICWLLQLRAQLTRWPQVPLCYLADSWVPFGQEDRYTCQSVGRTDLDRMHRTGCSPSRIDFQGKLKETESFVKHPGYPMPDFTSNGGRILQVESASFLSQLMCFKITTMKTKPTQRHDCFFLRNFFGGYK